MATTIDQVRKTVDQRLEELKPLAEEYLALQKLREETLRVFDQTNGGTVEVTVEGQKPVAKAPATKGRQKAKVRKPSMTEKVLAAVQAHPEGIGINEISDKVETATSYVYAITRKLAEEEKVIRREGRIFPL